MMSDKYIAKIEGHGSMEIDWQKGKASLHVHEGERLFEGLLVGRTIEESHWITPRICGVCPIAHNLASLKACENGLKIEISKTSKLLRQLMVCAQMMQSHMLHLFFLSLPDYLGIDRGTELARKNPKAFKAALDIKEISDEIAAIIAGRNVHPTTTTIGGFHKIPAKGDLEKLLEKVKKTRKSAEHALKLVSKIEFPELKVDLELVAQKDGKIVSSKGEAPTPAEGEVGVPAPEDVGNYKKVIIEEIRNYSTAKFGRYKGREIFVGALARLYFSKDGPRDKLDFQNPFHNNLAQAIEILLYHQKSEDILNQLLTLPTYDVGSPPTSYVGKSGAGVSAIEAPRGGLYHEFRWNEKGIITYANIITPTVQNLTSIEKSAQTLLEQCLSRAESRETTEKLLNMLIRAYDPCITCSVH